MNLDEKVDKLIENTAKLEKGQDDLEERMNRLMDLLTPRIEKWDETTSNVKILMQERSSWLGPRSISLFSGITTATVGAIVGLLEWMKSGKH